MWTNISLVNVNELETVRFNDAFSVNSFTTRKLHPLSAHTQKTTGWESRDVNNVSVLECSVFAVHISRAGLRFQWAPLLKSSHVRVFDCFSLDGTCLSTRDRVIRR